jgi:hypothetical protein
MTIARITLLQRTKMEPLKDVHQQPKTFPQDQTTSVQGDCNPHKKNKIQQNQPEKYIKYEKITERQQHKNNHTRLQDQRSGRWRRYGMP